jgi:predicted aspartyl protease
MMNRWPVISERFPFLPVIVEFAGDVREFDALLDTGFDGDLVLPARMIPVGEPVFARLRFRLADETSVRIPVFQAAAVVGGSRVRRAYVASVGSVPMIGRRLIRHFAVTLDHGRRVVVEP